MLNRPDLDRPIFTAADARDLRRAQVTWVLLYTAYVFAIGLATGVILFGRT